jgi:hypothetical protein
VATDIGLTDTSLPDGSLADTGSLDLGNTADEGPLPDAGGNADIGDIAYRLAYFPGSGAPAFVDLCWLRQNGPTEWTRAYGAPGIGFEQVGRYVTLARGNHTFRIIDVNSTCDSPIFESTTTLGNDSVVSRPTFVYSAGRTPGVNGTLYQARFAAADLTGEDRLHAYSLATTAFIDGIFFDGPTRSVIGTSLDVPAGTVGEVVVDIFEAPEHTIPYRAGSAVSTSIFVVGDGTEVLLCDDFGAPSGTLTPCSPTLRAP